MYIYLKPGISKKEILKKYNSNNLFEQRIRRLKSLIQKNILLFDIIQGEG